MRRTSITHDKCGLELEARLRHMSEPSFRPRSWTPAPASPRTGAAAWEAAFATCYVELCEYVLRLVGSAEAAEDVVHDLFLQLWDTRGAPGCRADAGRCSSCAAGTRCPMTRSRRVSACRWEP